MALFPLFKKSAVVANPEITATPTFFPLEFVNHFLAAGSSASDKKFLELYLSVPELQAIINYRARVFADMRIKAVNEAGDEKEIPQLKLFSKPNPIQNFKEFAMQYHVLRDIFGNDFIHPIFGNDPKQAQVMWNLPPCGAEVIPSDSLKSQEAVLFRMTDEDEIIKKYKFSYESGHITFEPNEIIHYNDNQVDFNENRFLLGDSKIRPIQQACENIKNAYEARGVLIQNAALGILTNEGKDGIGTAPITPKEKKELQDDYKRYGLTKEKWQMIITNMSLKYQSMTTDTGKLKLFEEVDSDFRTVANAYSFPPEILQTDSTYENKQRAITQLYQDTIIPEANEWLQGFTNFFQLEGVFLKADFSHVAALQSDLEKRSKSMDRAATGLSKALESGFVQLPEAEEEFKKYLL